MSRARGPRPHSGHRRHRRRPPREGTSGPLKLRWTAELVDELIDRMAEGVLMAQRRYPRELYAGRIYSCPSCSTLHGCVAPAEDLVDDYPCPSCGAPQEAVTEPGVPRAIAT